MWTLFYLDYPSKNMFTRGRTLYRQNIMYENILCLLVIQKIYLTFIVILNRTN